MITAALLSLWENDSDKGVLQHIWSDTSTPKPCPSLTLSHFALLPLRLRKELLSISHVTELLAGRAWT